MPTSLPIIRLEVQAMQYVVQTMLTEHWVTSELTGAPASFQRAAREYAEEYAATVVAAERERLARLCAAKFEELAAKNRGNGSDYHSGALDAWDMAERLIRGRAEDTQLVPDPTRTDCN